MGLLSFIPIGIGALLIAIGTLALFMPKVKSFLKILPFFKPQMWAIALIVVGVVAGGVGFITNAVTGVTATVGLGAETQPSVIGETMIDKCVYTSGISTANITVRTDASQSNIVYLDADESLLVADNKQTQINVNFTCTRLGSIAEDGATHMVVSSPLFLNEVTTSDSSLYSIVTDSASTSSVWAGQNEKSIYVGENGVDLTNTVEEEWITYSEGEKSLVLSIQSNLSTGNLDRLDNYSSIDIDVFQRLDSGTENQVATIVINKIP